MKKYLAGYRNCSSTPSLAHPLLWKRKTLHWEKTLLPSQDLRDRGWYKGGAPLSGPISFEVNFLGFYLDGAVAGGGDQKVTAGMEIDSVDVIRVRRIVLQQLVRPQVPQLYIPVSRSGGDTGTVFQ